MFNVQNSTWVAVDQIGIFLLAKVDLNIKIFKRFVQSTRYNFYMIVMYQKKNKDMITCPLYMVMNPTRKTSLSLSEPILIYSQYASAFHVAFVCLA